MKGKLESINGAIPSGDMLLAILDAAPQAILITDSEGKIIIANEQAGQIFGYSPEELIAAPMSNLLPDQLRKMHHRHYEKYAQNPYGRPMGHGPDLRAKHKDGTIFPVEIGLGHLKTQNGVFIVAFISDVSERKRLEEMIVKTERLRAELDKERELNQVKSYFVSMITHDFRTPLNIIQLAVDNLRKGFEQHSLEKREKIFARLHENIKRINDMIDQTLDVGRAESGAVVLSPKPLDLMQFCLQLVDTIQTIAGKNYELELHYGISETIHMVDQNVVHHILSNLLSNAVKYSPDGGKIQLEVQEDDNFLIFKVRDHGIGIPENEFETLFHPFNRAKNVGKIPGTGLGLAVAKGYTEVHGGTISCHSKENIGSVFTVRLPKVSAPLTSV